MAYLALLLAISYALGSIPTSVWIGRLFYHIDIREHGSGNAGATNTFRVLGWKAGIITLLIDAGKGYMATAIVAPAFASELLSWFPSLTLIQLLAGIAAVAGHMYPVFARFRGGKGVATAAGALLAIEPLSLSLSVLVFLLVLLTTRYVSVASISAALFFPLSLLLQQLLFHRTIDPSLYVLGALLALAIVYAHRSNIQRLLRGEESRVRSFRPARGRIHEISTTD